MLWVKTKIPTDSEIKNKKLLKKIFISQTLLSHKLSENDFLLMRSSIKNLIPANEYKLILGKELVSDVNFIANKKRWVFLMKKICLVTINRSDFGIQKNLIKIKLDKKFKTELIVSGSHLSKQHGKTISEIIDAGIHSDRKLI